MAPVVALVDERAEGVAPLVEPEGVGQHPVRSMRPLADEVEVVLDGVLADALDLLDAERVRADQAQLLEVPRRPLARAHDDSPICTIVPRAASTRRPTSSVAGAPTVS